MYLEASWKDQRDPEGGGDAADPVPESGLDKGMHHSARHSQQSHVLGMHMIQASIPAVDEPWKCQSSLYCSWH